MGVGRSTPRKNNVGEHITNQGDGRVYPASGAGGEGVVCAYTTSFFPVVTVFSPQQGTPTRLRTAKPPEGHPCRRWAARAKTKTKKSYPKSLVRPFAEGSSQFFCAQRTSKCMSDANAGDDLDSAIGVHFIVSFGLSSTWAWVPTDHFIGCLI